MSFVDTGEEAAASALLAMSEEQVFADFCGRLELTGAVVAEIGGAFPTDLLREHRVARWVSVDPNREPSGEDSDIRQVVAEPAERMSLPDESCSAVFSCNAMQFVDVVQTLAEVRRVLRPGGLFYAHFGPIWSAVDGHQLEYVHYRGRQLTFWDDTLLPPWSHLSYDRAQLRALLGSALEDELVDLLVWHVHDSATINRYFFDDYIQAALGSGLRWVEVAATDHLDYPIEPPAYDARLARQVSRQQLAAEISLSRGRPTQLGPRDVRMVLRK